MSEGEISTGRRPGSTRSGALRRVPRTAGSTRAWDRIAPPRGIASKKAPFNGASLGTVLALTLLLHSGAPAFARNQHSLPLFLSADAGSGGQGGFARIINSSARAGTVRIHAIDDSGTTYGPVLLSLDADAAVHLTSRDLEQGNSAKGLSGGVGDGEGNWRLTFDTDLDIEPLVYVRTSDGFVTSVHDVAQGASMRWHVPFFNPGNNHRQQSRLRLINTSGIDTEVVIEGRDDRGAPAPEGEVRFDLPGGAARTLSARDLEEGYSASQSDFEFDGRFGDGQGKWRLVVSAGRPLQVMSLLVTPTGHLTNLSTVVRDDIIRGSDGPDELWGGNGDDVINPGDNHEGQDIVHGSAGDDTIIYTDSGVAAIQTLDYSLYPAADQVGPDPDTFGVKITVDGFSNRATVYKGDPDDISGFDDIVDVANPLSAGSGLLPRGAFLLLGTQFNDTFDLALDEGHWMRVDGGDGADTFNVSGDGDVMLGYEGAPAGVDVDLGAGRVRNDGFGDVDTINGRVFGVRGSTSPTPSAVATTGR